MKGVLEVKRIVSVERYIGELRTILRVRDDFKDIGYYRNAVGAEYMVLSDIIGHIIILDVTGFEPTDILHNVAEILNGKTPKNAITDRAEMLKIARLF